MKGDDDTAPDNAKKDAFEEEGVEDDENAGTFVSIKSMDGNRADRIDRVGSMVKAPDSDAGW